MSKIYELPAKKQKKPNTLLIWCAKKLCTLSKGSCKVVEISAKGALKVGENSVTRIKDSK